MLNKIDYYYFKRKPLLKKHLGSEKQDIRVNFVGIVFYPGFIYTDVYTFPFRFSHLVHQFSDKGLILGTKFNILTNENLKKRYGTFLLVIKVNVQLKIQ